MKFIAHTVSLSKRETTTDYNGIKEESVIVEVHLISSGDTSNYETQELLNKILNKLKEV